MTTSSLIELLKEMEKRHGVMPVKFVVDRCAVVPAWCVAYAPGEHEEFEFVLDTYARQGKEAK